MESVKKEYEEDQRKAGKLTKAPQLSKLPDYWSPYHYGKYDPAYEVDTGLSREKLAEITEGLVRTPSGFHVHPKIVKLLEQRSDMGHGKKPVDYGFAELLAYGSLVLEGTPVRLTGQDSQRGTFNQRHAMLIDTQTEEEYLPLAHLSANQAFCEIHNSSLSEAACLGFEYGFSRDYPEGLVLWEAQFGDFVNGAQIIIDQFISASEDKWGLPTGLVLLSASWLRRSGTGAFKRTDRALHAACGRRQYEHLPAFYRCTVFSFAAPCGPPPVAQAARDFYA